MMMTNPNDDMLDDLFATARAGARTPGDDMTARVLADAQTEQDNFAPLSRAKPPSLWFMMKDALGGWPALSGLAAAMVAGVWIGVAPPNAVQDLTAGLLGDEVSVGLMPLSYGFETGAFIDG